MNKQMEALVQAVSQHVAMQSQPSASAPYARRDEAGDKVLSAMREQVQQMEAAVTAQLRSHERDVRRLTEQMCALESRSAQQVEPASVRARAHGTEERSELRVRVRQLAAAPITPRRRRRIIRRLKPARTSHCSAEPLNHGLW